ncbi:MAG TPA: DUF11 domain-containing protein, partial [Kofleriaceae bacterium]|nr:DUF11 domain-containing protein [Kofleriaceae bacterium]
MTLAFASTACVVLPPADLAISIADPTDAMATDGTLSYTITVTDTGPADATEIIVLDHLPPGAAFVSASGPGWSCAPVDHDVMCLDQAITAAAASQITLVVTPPPSGGAISSTAQVTAVTPDVNPSNNTATTTTTVDTASDLSIALRHSPAPAAGGTLQYSIDVTNAGPSVASGVTVTNALPAGITASAVTGVGWDCRITAQAISCARPSVLVGAAPTIDITVAAPDRPATLVDTASVASASPDLVPDNNSTEVTGCSQTLPPSQLTVLHTLHDPDGLAVRGALTEANGRLYGLAGERGPNGTTACSSSASWNTIEHLDHCPGSLFSLRLDGSDFRVEHAFSRLDDLTGRNLDGYHPYGSLARSPDGRLHGVTQMGGMPIDGRGAGVAFTFDPVTGAFVTDHSFFAVPRAFDGEYPMGVPAVLPTGEVLGTAKAGGTSGAGTVWRASSSGFSYASLTPDTGTSYGGLT